MMLLIPRCLHLTVYTPAIIDGICHKCRGLHILPASCSVGLSGIIFALLVADNHLRSVQYRSVYGLFNVPAVYFPWVLLILWQLVLPHVSLFGHLGGIVAGTLYSLGCLKWLIPQTSTLQVWPGLQF